jgi:hypothetical protein
MDLKKVSNQNLQYPFFFLLFSFFNSTFSLKNVFLGGLISVFSVDILFIPVDPCVYFGFCICSSRLQWIRSYIFFFFFL